MHVLSDADGTPFTTYSTLLLAFVSPSVVMLLYAVHLKMGCWEADQQSAYQWLILHSAWASTEFILLLSSFIGVFAPTITLIIVVPLFTAILRVALPGFKGGYLPPAAEGTNAMLHKMHIHKSPHRQSEQRPEVFYRHTELRGDPFHRQNEMRPDPAYRQSELLSDPAYIQNELPRSEPVYRQSELPRSEPVYTASEQYTDMSYRQNASEQQQQRVDSEWV